MKQIHFLMAFLLANTGLKSQDSCVTYPTARTKMEVNRLRFPSVQPAGFLGASTSWAEASSTDYNGSEQPIAGIVSAGFWVGGVDSSEQIKLSAMYPHIPSVQGFRYAAGPKGNVNCASWDRQWVVSGVSLRAFRADWSDGALDQPVAEILGWPGRGNPYFFQENGFELPPDLSAPFFDANGDGSYNPYTGDFPQPNGVDTSVVPERILWSVFHDPTVDFAGDVDGMGFEYDWTIWATICSDTSVIDGTVFFSMRIKNTSGQPMDSVIMGIRTDKFLGRDHDDGVGTRADLNTLFFYNLSPDDLQQQPSGRKSYGPNPPATAWTVLNRPLYKTMHTIDLNCQTNTQMYLPFDGNAAQFYHLLNARWRNGKPLVKYGMGYAEEPHPYPVSDYVFDGDIFDMNQWSVRSQNMACIGQYDPIFSVFLGSMQPGQSETVDYAYSFHRAADKDHLQQVPYLFGRIQQLQSYYDAHFAQACPPADCVADCVWPGDANADGIVDAKDVLPIGLKLGAEGPARTHPLINWRGYEAPDWGENFQDLPDVKHIDANGDGLIDTSDFKVMGVQNWQSQRSDYQAPADVFIEGTTCFLSVPLPVSSAVSVDSVPPGRNFWIRVGIADSIVGVRGLFVELELDTAYWEVLLPLVFKADSLWMYRIGIKNGNSVQVGLVSMKYDLKMTTGLIRVRSKSIPADFPKETFIRAKNIEARAADGQLIELGSWPFRFCFGGGCTTATGEAPEVGIAIYPVPTRRFFQIVSTEKGIVSCWITDAIGRVVSEHNFADAPLDVQISMQDLPAGYYNVIVQNTDGRTMRRGQVLIK